MRAEASLPLACCSFRGHVSPALLPDLAGSRGPGSAPASADLVRVALRWVAIRLWSRGIGTQVQQEEAGVLGSPEEEGPMGLVSAGAGAGGRCSEAQGMLLSGAKRDVRSRAWPEPTPHD